MLGPMIVLGSMFVLGRVAASHMATFQAQPQMYPGVSNLDAVFANMGFGVRDLNLVEMSTGIRHLIPPVLPQRSKALRSHFASVAAAS
jgi:hypothetical protein